MRSYFTEIRDTLLVLEKRHQKDSECPLQASGCEFEDNSNYVRVKFDSNRTVSFFDKFLGRDCCAALAGSELLLSLQKVDERGQKIRLCSGSYGAVRYQFELQITKSDEAIALLDKAINDLLFEKNINEIWRVYQKAAADIQKTIGRGDRGQTVLEKIAAKGRIYPESAVYSLK